MHRTPRVGARYDSGTRADSSPIDGGDLALPDLTGQLGLECGVGATGPAAQTVVIEFDHVGDMGQQRANRTVDALHVPEVARILHDDARPLARRPMVGRG